MITRDKTITSNKDSKKEPKQSQHKPQFYYPKKDQEGNVVDLGINFLELNLLLKSFGFARYDIDNKTSTFIKINDNIINEVNKQNIIDHFEEYIRKLKTDKDGVSPQFIINKMYKGLGTYFNDNFLQRLVVDKKIEFNNDTKKSAFFYFNNGFIECTEEGYSINKYSKIQKYIWGSQVNDKKFTNLEFFDDKKWGDKGLDEWGPFALFCYNISGKIQQRWHSLLSIIGYNLHNCFEGKMKATVLTDSTISDYAEGRTGKTLLGKALTYVRNLTEIPGKDFKSMDKHRYATATIDTQIVHINDVVKYFDIEMMFNDITEGIKVDPKGRDPFTILAKIMISTNRTIYIEGASAKDRTIEFELSDHYSDKLSPADEFGHWFFTDWDDEEWNRFFNFMMYCAHFYLKHGLIVPDGINLERRKLIEGTCHEFVGFMESDIKVELGVEYKKRELFEGFVKAYPDYNNPKFKQRRFTSFLKKFARFMRYEIEERRSNGDDLITFHQTIKSDD